LIVAAANAHVVGHDVHDQPHARAAQSGGQGVEPVPASQFGIEALMVHDVVAMGGAGPGHEDGGGVDMADAQVAQIGNDLQGMGKGEAGVKLQPVQGNGMVERVHGQALDGGEWMVFRYLMNEIDDLRRKIEESP